MALKSEWIKHAKIFSLASAMDFNYLVRILSQTVAISFLILLQRTSAEGLEWCLGMISPMQTKACPAQTNLAHLRRIGANIPLTIEAIGESRQLRDTWQP